MTDAIESAVAGSVSEAAKISRTIQQAIYQDAEAFFAGIDKLASAKSLNEAVQIQSDMVRARGEVFVSRAKSTTEYLGKLVADGAKTAQDNFSKVYTQDRLIAIPGQTVNFEGPLRRAFFLSGAMSSSRCGGAISSLRGAQATKQSSLSSTCSAGLLRFARNDGCCVSCLEF